MLFYFMDSTVLYYFVLYLDFINICCSIYIVYGLYYFMFVLLLNMMNNSNRGTSSNRGVARGGSISGHGSNEEGECHCKFCFLRKRFGSQPIRFELSDNDFVENLYGYGLKKN